MIKPERGNRFATLIFVLAGLIFAPFALADDQDDVVAVIKQYGDLEDDIAAQSKLMRSDRVYITGGIRLTDEAKNMAIQMANREAFETASGGKLRFMTIIESPHVAIYGNVAVGALFESSTHIRTTSRRILRVSQTG